MSATTVESATTATTPALYLPHGGGPWPFVDVGPMIPPGSGEDELLAFFRGLPSLPAAPPRAIVVISAHWEERVPTVMSAPRPPMLYDYGGFPAAAYTLTWPAPGSPELAAELREALAEAGIESAEDPRRGFDHGAFVVTKVAYPEPSIPTIQLSLTRDLDPARHLALGRALAPLRRRGVYFLGSGQSYHSFPGFSRLRRGDGRALDEARAFDGWLAETVLEEPSARERRLIEWERAPAARACHPREEHLLPLMVIAGLGSEGEASLPFRATVLGAPALAAQFS